MKVKELDILLDKVIKIANQAGEKILTYYGQDLDIKDKGNNSPVTKADIASNEIIVTELRKLNIPILSEEGVNDDNRFDSDYVWIIDPLDGTKDFIQETGEFTIMIGLVEKQDSGKYRPILGVIYQPATKEVYYALKNNGAWLLSSNNKLRKLTVSEEKISSKAQMLTSRNHTTDLEKKIAEKLDIRKIKTYGSSLKACLIADKKGDINFNPAPFTWEWDICASDIIVHEAGGLFTDTKGKLFSYNKKDPRNNHGYVASNGIIHDDIIASIKKN